MINGEEATNFVSIYGEICKEFKFSHKKFGESFYETFIKSKRLSGNVDIIPVIVSERLADVSEKWVGRTVYMNGTIRSYNKHENGKTKLMLHVFARYFAECDAEEHEENKVYLSGYICTPVSYRETPLGRTVTDVILAVNRSYGKSDYIPCIFWGRNAKFASTLEVGAHIKLHGRFQSRGYVKQMPDGEKVPMTAYEVSASSLEAVFDEREEEA